MTDKTRELLERALEALQENEYEPHYSLQEAILEYLAEPEVKALSDDEVDSLFTCDETSPEYEHGFRDGIWFAEKHYGIGEDNA